MQPGIETTSIIKVQMLGFRSYPASGLGWHRWSYLNNPLIKGGYLQLLRMNNLEIVKVVNIHPALSVYNKALVSFVEQ